MKNAIHELHHSIDGGADYCQTVMWVAKKFGIKQEQLEIAYHIYVMSH